MSEEAMVFLSYAREDQEDAKKIFNNLRKNGVSVWADFDDVSLPPGSKWEPAIKRAIRESRYFLAILSSNSVSKKGFVQKEIVIALEILDEFPEKDIFLIPVRLNECSPSHEKLKEIHWIDMFPSWEDGISKILSVVAHLKKQKSDSPFSDMIDPIVGLTSMVVSGTAENLLEDYNFIVNNNDTSTAVDEITQVIADKLEELKKTEEEQRMRMKEAEKEVNQESRKIGTALSGTFLSAYGIATTNVEKILKKIKMYRKSHKPEEILKLIDSELRDFQRRWHKT